MGGGKKKQSPAKSLGNLGDESQGARRRVGRRTRREAEDPQQSGPPRRGGAGRRGGEGPLAELGRGADAPGTAHRGLEELNKERLC